MARILFTTWPFPGHVLPHLAIAQALRERGNECVFYTGTRAFQILDKEGFRYFPFHGVDEEGLFHLLFGARQGYVDWKGMFTLPSLMRRWLLDTLRPQVTDLVAVLEEWKPDIIATDPTMWGPILVLHEKYSIPVAVAAYFCCMVPGPDAPPFGLGLPPPRTSLSRWSNRLLSRGVDWLTADFRRYASSIRQSYGLPKLTTSVTAFAGTMPLYLVPSSPEFDYDRRDLPPPSATLDRACGSNATLRRRHGWISCHATARGCTPRKVPFTSLGRWCWARLHEGWQTCRWKLF